MRSKTEHLLKSPLFRKRFGVDDTGLDIRARARVSYERAMAIGTAFDMTAEDLSTLSRKFWDLHSDPLLTFDGAAATLLTIQYNLVAGTLAQYLPSRNDLTPLVDDLLRYKIIGQFCLTELDHGLDARNLETTATLLPSGEFTIHTSTPRASKYMPPTIPVGIPCIGIVFARLMVDGEDRGVRPFIVPLNDGSSMYPGITARLLPWRGGTNPVNHSTTSFRNVRVPHSALLGPMDKPKNLRAAFFECIQRVAVGSIALACTGLTMMEVMIYIGAKYSLRRMVGPPGHQSPILRFRTQQIPILSALAQVHVLRALSNWATRYFSDPSIDFRVRHAVAACMKAVVIQCAQAATLSVSERCGAQGLFSVNQMSTFHAELRGIAIAEGDILAISIRLVAELLLGRYELPETVDPNSLLARHETGLFEERRTILALDSLHHEGRMSENHLLPYCQAMVEAAGHRMAYDAARAAGVMPALIDLYLSSIIKLDPAWYVENADMSRSAQAQMEDAALDAVLPHASSLAEGLDVAYCTTAPIVSDAEWETFSNSLSSFEGQRGYSDHSDYGLGVPVL
ncbi:acyl-CoA dehydrogenase NM domain-like protein [Infundibulicybe gibba]|nr:acyl-CoA dehydrogenase NM domain-like protein [Infundibulicybe gibba]